MKNEEYNLLPETTEAMEAYWFRDRYNTTENPAGSDRDRTRLMADIVRPYLETNDAGDYVISLENTILLVEALANIAWADGYSGS